MHNGRFDAFPPSVTRWLDWNYAHFWGSIHLYAPRFQASTRELAVWFPGRYRVALSGRSSLRIEGSRVHDGEVLTLDAGTLRIRPRASGRLFLMAPRLKTPLRPRHRLEREMFRDVYKR